VDRLEGELGPCHVARQRTAQARRRHRKPQHRAATVGDMEVIARARTSDRRRQRELAPIERVTRIGDGDRLGHLRVRIAPQGIKVLALTTANPSTAPWPSASLTRQRRWSFRRAPPPCRARPPTPHPVSATSTSGRSRTGAAWAGRRRSAMAGAHSGKPPCSGTRPSSVVVFAPGLCLLRRPRPGSLFGTQPDDPARYAGVAAHRLTDGDSHRPTTISRFVHQSLAPQVIACPFQAPNMRQSRYWLASRLDPQPDTGLHAGADPLGGHRG
jgi:hypothetical protein